MPANSLTPLSSDRVDLPKETPPGSSSLLADTFLEPRMQRSPAPARAPVLSLLSADDAEVVDYLEEPSVTAYGTAQQATGLPLSVPSPSIDFFAQGGSAFIGMAPKTAAAFISIRGRRVFGVLIDPGASSGLIGSATLKSLATEVLKPAGRAHAARWKKSGTTCSGISAKTESSLGRVTIPIGLKGFRRAFFSAGVI